jgi:hypothetical protein
MEFNMATYSGYNWPKLNPKSKEIHKRRQKLAHLEAKEKGTENAERSTQNIQTIFCRRAENHTITSHLTKQHYETKVYNKIYTQNRWIQTLAIEAEAAISLIDIQVQKY